MAAQNTTKQKARVTEITNKNLNWDKLKITDYLKTRNLETREEQRKTHTTYTQRVTREYATGGRHS